MISCCVGAKAHIENCIETKKKKRNRLPMFLLIYPFELSLKINRLPLQNTLFDPYWRDIQYNL